MKKMENFFNMEEWTCNSSRSIAAGELLARINAVGNIEFISHTTQRSPVGRLLTRWLDYIKALSWIHLGLHASKVCVGGSRGGSASFKAVMVIPLIMLSFMILMFADNCVFLLRKSTNLRRTGLLIWIISIYPVMGSLCITGLFMPRTAAVVAFARNFYFAIGMKKFFDLVLNYYGGKRKMVEALDGEIITANPIPFCCVCCDRNRPMTVWRLKKLKATVYQVLLVYPIAYFIQTLFAAEGLLQTSVAAQIVLILIQALVALSSFICLYGFAVIGRASRFTLQQYYILGKYLSVNLVVVCNSLQDFILEILQRFNVLSCYFPYPNSDRAFLFQCYILLFELFLISLLGWYSYRRSDENCEITTTGVSDMTFSNVSTQVKKASEIQVVGNDYETTKQYAKSWLQKENDSYKPSKITV